MPFLDILTIASLGLFVGTEFAPCLPSLLELSGNLRIARRPQRLLYLQRDSVTVMPFWYARNLLLLILEVVTRRHEPELALLIAATTDGMPEF